MKEKIVQLMKSEGLTSSRLAEVLEIQPSGISHLVSGRNKPSFELLKKILRSFPNINPYWLLLDDENMYRVTEPIILADDFIEPQGAPTQLADSMGGLFSSPSPAVSALKQEAPSVGAAAASLNEINESSRVEQNGARLAQVILLYEDGSCRSYSMR